MAIEWAPTLSVERDINEERIAATVIRDIKNAVEAFGQVSEKIKPALCLHLFNAYIKNNRQEPAGGYEQELEKERAKIENIIEAEEKALENPYLPTIGVEVELPDRSDFMVNQSLLNATSKLGLINDPAIHQDGVSWEFANDFSYSAKTQSLIVHELIEGDYIKTSSTKQHRYIEGLGDYSMHLNLGVPLELSENLFNGLNRKEPADVNMWNRYKYNSYLLTSCMTYAFTSADRLEKRKTSVMVGLDFTAKKTAKKTRDEQSETINQWNFPGRIEIRSLEVRDASLYRLLNEAQLLGSAVLAEVKPEEKRDEIERALVVFWSVFRNEAGDILADHNISLKSIDSDPLEAASIVRNSNISKQMRALITKISQAINGLVNYEEK